MKKFIHSLTKLIGEKYRLQIYRKFCHVPDKSLHPDIRLEIATTKDDLRQAYALLHDCYVGINIIDPQASGLRCNFFSFLPNTTTIVAKMDGQVIGTLSLIRDSSFGLPSDKEFLAENNKFRANQKTLIEVSALAVSSAHRDAHHSVSLLLMKYLYNFSKQLLCGDHLVAVVHPKAEDFYKALWQFERNGKVIQYNSLKKALGVHLSMDLSDEHLAQITKNFGKKDHRKNLPYFVQLADPRFHYPIPTAGKSIYPVLTPDLLTYFCLEFKDVWAHLSQPEQNSVIQIYSTYFGEQSIQLLVDREIPQKNFRTPLQLQSLLQVDENALFGSILDLSSGGCFVNLTDQMLPLQSQIQISFKLNGKSYKAKGEVAWRNDQKSLHQNRGVGIRFLQDIPELNSQIKNWLYDSSLESSLLSTKPNKISNFKRYKETSKKKEAA